MRLRQLKAEALGRLGRLDGSPAHSGKERPRLPILVYHRILPEAEWPHDLDTDLVSATPEAFERQMAFVAGHFTPVTFRQLANHCLGEEPLPDNPIIITLDDGYRDSYRYAFPILKRHGLRACFFVITGLVESGGIPWWDEVARYVKGTPKQTLTLTPWLKDPLRLGDGHSRITAVRDCLRAVKLLPNKERLAFLETLRVASGVAHSNGHHPSLLCGWGELGEMAQAGMEIGSHSATHPVLSHLETPEEIRREIEGSKAAIEAALGVPVQAFSYAGLHTPALEDAVRAAGYRFAVHFVEGANLFPLRNPWRLHRLRVEADVSLNEFKAMLVHPWCQPELVE